MARPTHEEYFLSMTRLVATRGTCPRRQVGCVLVNKHNHIIATGYNGVARGHVHCIEHPCPGAHYPSGQGLEKCQALHAEQNALLQCKDVNEIVTAYVTTAPCVHCTKLLLNTSCLNIVYIDDYPGSEDSKRLWTPEFVNPQRTWNQFIL